MVSKAAVEGWNAPFIGIGHAVLARNIRKMFETAIKDSPGRGCMTHASIIQSAGSGKSRLVDEVAKTTFTIPFNLREARDVAGKLFPTLLWSRVRSYHGLGGAWPPADDEIRDLLGQWAAEDGETRLYARLLCFFAVVFEETRKEVEQCMPQPASEDMASIWRIHLAEKGSEKRNALYSRVVNSEAVSYNRSPCLQCESSLTRSYIDTG